MGAKTKKMYPAKAQLKKRTQFPSNKFEAEQRLKKSKAAKKGWNTKRAKQQAAQQIPPQKVAVGSERTVAIPKDAYKMLEDHMQVMKVSVVPNGKITDAALANNTSASMLLGTLRTLSEKLCDKLGHVSSPGGIDEKGESRDISSLAILRAQEETRDTLQLCQREVEYLIRLQEEML